MFLTSLILFALCLLVIAVAFARGLSNIDDILQVVGPDGEPLAPSPTAKPSAPVRHHAQPFGTRRPIV